MVTSSSRLTSLRVVLAEVLVIGLVELHGGLVGVSVKLMGVGSRERSSKHGLCTHFWCREVSKPHGVVIVEE